MSPKKSRNSKMITITKGALGFILILIVLWLFGGIIFNILTRTYVINWPLGLLIFPFSSRIGFSIIILLIIILLFLGYWNKYWDWLGKKISKILKDCQKVGENDEHVYNKSQLRGSIFLIIIFYINILLFTKQFPKWTGYEFINDWSLILVAAVPIIVFGMLLAIEKISRFTAKVGGIEIGLEKAGISNLFESPEIQYSELEEVFKQKLSDLQEIRKGITITDRPPRILVVQFKHLVINFIILRHYIYELSKIAPLEYIVFIDESKKFIGFTTVQNFKERYPKFNLEILLDDFPIYPMSNQGERYFKYWEKIINFKDLKKERQNLNQIRIKLLLSQWNPYVLHEQVEGDTLHESHFTIKYENIGNLHLNKNRINDTATAIKAYQKMVDEGFMGIPIVSDKNEYLGIVTKESIFDKIITQILERAIKVEKSP
ncbi:CBS domain-containing protein [Chloroflexota bacterium]